MDYFWPHSAGSPFSVFLGMVETPRLEAKENFVQYGSVKRYQIGAHTKHNLKVHFVWIANAEK